MDFAANSSCGKSWKASCEGIRFLEAVCAHFVPVFSLFIMASGYWNSMEVKQRRYPCLLCVHKCFEISCSVILSLLVTYLEWKEKKSALAINETFPSYYRKRRYTIKSHMKNRSPDRKSDSVINRVLCQETEIAFLRTHL